MADDKTKLRNSTRDSGACYVRQCFCAARIVLRRYSRKGDLS